jgi:hypothetical protein
VAVELVAGLVWGLGIVFTAFAEDVGADDFDANGNLLHLDNIANRLIEMSSAGR